MGQPAQPANPTGPGQPTPGLHMPPMTPETLTHSPLAPTPPLPIRSGSGSIPRSSTPDAGDLPVSALDRRCLLSSWPPRPSSPSPNRLPAPRCRPVVLVSSSPRCRAGRLRHGHLVVTPSLAPNPVDAVLPPEGLTVAGPPCRRCSSPGTPPPRRASPDSSSSRLCSTTGLGEPRPPSLPVVL